MNFRKFLILALTVAVLSYCSLPVAQAMSTFIPGAHSVTVRQYEDLTTNNPAIGSLAEARRIALAPSDYSGDGKPKRFDWYTAQDKVPGLEISGMFDDAKFVIRIPTKWNGKLVMMGAPGVGDERSTDTIVSDYVLTKFDLLGESFAYACIDKGTTGEMIPAPDGKIYPWAKSLTALVHEQDTISEWNSRLHQLTVATKALLKRTRGQEPSRTYLIGMSNGGYVARYAIENDAALYDGAVDWEGVLWRANDANLLSSLTDAVNSWEVIKNPNSTDEEKERAYSIFANYGVPREAGFLVEYHGKMVYLPTLNQYRNKLDPDYIQRGWWEFLANPQDYKNYNYLSRPDKVKNEVAAFQNTGNIKKPLITVHGTWDALLFSPVHTAAYETLVKKAGKSELYRLYMVEHGNHFDGLVGNPAVDKGNQLQALLPYVHQSFDLLVDWVEKGASPPSSRTLGIPSSRDNAFDIVTGQEVKKY